MVVHAMALHSPPTPYADLATPNTSSPPSPPTQLKGRRELDAAQIALESEHASRARDAAVGAADDEASGQSPPLEIDLAAVDDASVSEGGHEASKVSNRSKVSKELASGCLSFRLPAGEAGKYGREAVEGSALRHLGVSDLRLRNSSHTPAAFKLEALGEAAAARFSYVPASGVVPAGCGVDVLVFLR